MSTTPRVITAKFAGRCWECKRPFPEGERISYLPADGDRKSRSSHLACVSISPYTTPDEPRREVERQMRATRTNEAATARVEESLPTVQQRPADPTPGRSLVGDGFPVSRQPRAGHMRPPSVQRQIVRTTEPPKAYADNPDCLVCQRGGPGPSHNGSPRCRSGSPASGGRHAHCSCDTCY